MERQCGANYAEQTEHCLISWGRYEFLQEVNDDPSSTRQVISPECRAAHVNLCGSMKSVRIHSGCGASFHHESDISAWTKNLTSSWINTVGFIVYEMHDFIYDTSLSLFDLFRSNLKCVKHPTFQYLLIHAVIFSLMSPSNCHFLLKS